jgi:hypothetical protein
MQESESHHHKHGINTSKSEKKPGIDREYNQNNGEYRSIILQLCSVQFESLQL